MKIPLSSLDRPKRKPSRSKLPGEPRPFVPRKPADSLRNLTTPRTSVQSLGPDEITEAQKKKELTEILKAEGVYSSDLFNRLLAWEKKL